MISEFGEGKIHWLRKYFPYSNGIPSHDTLGAIFSVLDSKEFAKCFKKFTEFLEKEVSGLVAIDGKTIRGVASSNGSKLHIVSAYSEVNRLTLSQVPISAKSNEITAIPELFDLMFVEGCVISIDAMVCQKEIAKKIIDKKADYILQVKGNQKDMKSQIEKLFSLGLAKDSCENLDVGHGRVGKTYLRSYYKP